MGNKPLIITNEFLMTQWHYEKNNALGFFPDRITLGSGKKVWWKCCNNHEWQADPYSRAHLRSGCPVCSGRSVKTGINDLESQQPELLVDWNYSRNILRPDEIYVNSEKKVWWLCHLCGHEWTSALSNRSLRKHGCPHCAAIKRGINRTIESTNDGENTISKVHPELLEEWNHSLNVDLNPDSIPPNYNKKVWWTCSLCGHSWQASPNKRSQGRGCPKCKAALHTSLPEQVIYFYIQKIFPDAINSYYPSFLNGKEIDIYIPSINLAIEYDGRAWHQNVSRDFEKSKTIIENGISLVRFREKGCPFFELSGISLIHVESVDKASAGQLNQPIQELVDFISTRYGVDVSININIDEEVPLILKNYNDSVKENSLLTRFPILSHEWNKTKNKGLLPQHVYPGSSRKVWWQCPKCGYEWSASVASRVAGNGCPACSNQVVWNGRNDLATIMPDLLSEWDYEKNEILPTEVVVGSNRRTWWKCSKCGSSWEAIISSRTKHKTGCPVCSGKRIVKGVNDLESCFPKIAAEWDCERNINLQPSEVGIGSNRRVWWKCLKCGSVWNTTIHNRTSGSGCIQCARVNRSMTASIQNLVVGENDLETLFPELLQEWNYKKNMPLTPNGVSCGSSKKVWWVCKTCGHEWKTTIYHRALRKTGCPECAKGIRALKYTKQYIENNHTSLSDSYPDLLVDWNYEKNEEVIPSGVSYGSAVEVWWKCHICGFEWQASVKSRTTGSKCPCCNNKNAHKKAINKFLKSGENDLKTLFPTIAAEWDYEKNIDSPSEFTAGSGQKVWWKCSLCGHSWQAIIGNRTKHNSGCPKCAKEKMGPRKKQ